MPLSVVMENTAEQTMHQDFKQSGSLPTVHETPKTNSKSPKIVKLPKEVHIGGYTNLNLINEADDIRKS